MARSLASNIEGILAEPAENTTDTLETVHGIGPLLLHPISYLRKVYISHEATPHVREMRVAPGIDGVTGAALNGMNIIGQRSEKRMPHLHA